MYHISRSDSKTTFFIIILNLHRKLSDQFSFQLESSFSLNFSKGTNWTTSLTITNWAASLTITSPKLGSKRLFICIEDFHLGKVAGADFDDNDADRRFCSKNDFISCFPQIIDDSISQNEQDLICSRSNRLFGCNFSGFTNDK